MPRHGELLIQVVCEQRADEQEWNHPQAKQQQQRKAQAGAGIPRRDPEVRVRLDEADPIEHRVCRKIDKSDDHFVGVENSRESHRSHSLRLEFCWSLILNLSGDGTPGY